MPQVAKIVGMSQQDVACYIGTLDPAEGVRILQAYPLAFFDLHLRHRPSRLLDGPSPDFPAVKFIRGPRSAISDQQHREYQGTSGAAMTRSPGRRSPLHVSRPASQPSRPHNSSARSEAVPATSAPARRVRTPRSRPTSVAVSLSAVAGSAREPALDHARREELEDLGDGVGGEAPVRTARPRRSARARASQRCIRVSCTRRRCQNPTVRRHLAGERPRLGVPRRRRARW